MTKNDCLARIVEIEAETKKSAEAWILCRDGKKASEVIDRAQEQIAELQMLANMHWKARTSYIIRNWQ